MSCRRSHGISIALLASGILWVACASVRAEGEAKAEVEKLAADVAAGKKISDERVKALAKKYDDLEDVMNAFKVKKGQPTLEAVLNKLSKKTTFTPTDKAKLRKIADLSRALALLTPHYDSKTKGSAAKKKDWDKYTKDMDEGARELIAAIKGTDGKVVQKSATKLAGSCTDCHGAFR